MPDLDDLLDQVDEMRDEIVALERDMVRIPTVNTGFMPTGNETELCRYIEKWLAEDGVACEIIESAPDRGNLIARLEGSSGKAGLMFMSHLDVVPVEEEEKRRRRGGEVAVSSFQRHDCRWPGLWPRRIGLQGPARLPVNRLANSQAEWRPTQRQPDSGLLRRRGAWRPLRVWLDGR